MKQLRVAVALLIWCCPTLLFACDVCSNSGNQQLGILPQQGIHFAGIQYRYAQYRSRHASLFGVGPQIAATEQYHTLQAWGRYNIGRRLQLFAFVPWQQSIAAQEGARFVQQGLGDVTLMAATTLIKNKAAWQHALIIGGGIKMPTGRYNGVTQSDRNGLPNLQPGTGSWDVTANVNYTLQRPLWSVVAEASYLLATPNRFNYKYGNKSAASVIGLRRIRRGQNTWLPNAGARLEYALHDYDNYDRKRLNTATGGHVVYATAGCQWYSQKSGAQCSAAIPIHQYYAEGNVRTTVKAELGFFLLFKTNKKDK